MNRKFTLAALALFMTSGGGAFADEPTPDQKAFFDRLLTAAVATQECGFTLNKEVVEAAASKVGMPGKGDTRFSAYFKQAAQFHSQQLRENLRQTGITLKDMCPTWLLGFGADAPMPGSRNWLHK